MNLEEMIIELGPFTVMDELSKIKVLSSIQQEIANILPVVPTPGSEQSLRIALAQLLDEIPGLRKKKRIVLAGPELIILELLKKQELDIEVFVAVDSNINRDIVDRISDNTPADLFVRVNQIPEVPFSIQPANALLIAVGCNAGIGNALITRSTHNILNFYRALYFGEVILIDPFDFAIFNRPDGWIVVNRLQTFTQHINTV